MIASEQDAAARAAWQTDVATWNANHVVFLDATSTHTSLTRTRGRARRGQRVVGRVPRHHGPNVSCLAVLTPAGITAPLVIEGAIDGTVFPPWLRAWLLPALPPGTTIVRDNLRLPRRPDAGRGGRRPPALSACLFARRHPDRARLQHAQDASPRGGEPHPRAAGRGDRRRVGGHQRRRRARVVSALWRPLPR